MLTYLYVSIYLSSKHLEVVLSLLSIYSLVLNPLERKKKSNLPVNIIIHLRNNRIRNCQKYANHFKLS